MKACSKCKRKTHEFYRNKTKKDGLANQCKRCMNIDHVKRDHTKRRKRSNPMRTWPTDNLTVAERLSRGSIVRKSGCIEWLRAVQRGYGVLRIAGKNKRTHRLAYELSFGPIPSGLNVLHKCDNPACINPKHLFIGTQADNIKDMLNKGRGKNQWAK